MSVFGPIVTGADVEKYLLDTLKKWNGAYLAEMERLRGYTPFALPRIRSWTTVNEFGHWPEEQLPAVLLVSPGTSGEPVRRGDGKFEGSWTVGIAVIVSGRDRATTKDLAQIYVGALRVLLLQHQSLDGKADGVRWISERYNDDISAQAQRTLGAGQAIFEVMVKDVSDAGEGPLTPEDVGPRPTVTSTDVFVSPKED